MTVYAATLNDGIACASSGTPRAAFNGALIDTVTIKRIGGEMIPTWGKFATITEGFSVGSTETVTWRFGVQVADLIRFAQRSLTGALYHLSLAEKVTTKDKLTIAMVATLVDAFKLSSADAATMAVFLRDKIGIATVYQFQCWYGLTLLERIGFRDVLAKAYGYVIADHMDLGDAMTPIHKAVVACAEMLVMDASTTPILQIIVAEQDVLDFVEVDAISMLYHQLIGDNVNIELCVATPGSGFTTWAMNARTGGLTEYRNYAFNSFAQVGDRYLAADENGLYELIGEADQEDPIVSRIMPGALEMTGSNLTQLARAYVAMGEEGAGDVLLRLTDNRGSSTVYKVAVRPYKTSRINLGKGWRARYFVFELITLGQDFDLAGFQFMPVASQRKI